MNLLFLLAIKLRFLGHLRHSLLSYPGFLLLLIYLAYLFSFVIYMPIAAAV
jgi:hypothetical protein